MAINRQGEAQPDSCAGCCRSTERLEYDPISRLWWCAQCSKVSFPLTQKNEARHGS